MSIILPPVKYFLNTIQKTGGCNGLFLLIVVKCNLGYLESIKHITANKNSFRVLYPGVSYVFPPASEKLNPFDFSKEDLKIELSKNNNELDEKIFSKLLTGVGKNLSLEMYSLFKSQFGDSYVFDDIFNFICNYFNNIFKDIQNIIFYKNEKIIDFYFKDLSCLSLLAKKASKSSLLLS